MNDENLFIQFDAALQAYMSAAKEYLDALRRIFERDKPRPEYIIVKLDFFHSLDGHGGFGKAVSDDVQNLRMLAARIAQQTERYGGEFYVGITDRLLDRRNA